MSDSPFIGIAYAEKVLPVVAGMPLAGMAARRGRYAGSLRDPILVQALDLRSGGTRATIVTADLLIIPAVMHAGLARRTGVPAAELLLAATHTHSSLGGYWDCGKRAELFMGRYREEYRELVMETLFDAVRAARAAPAVPATLSAARLEVDGASFNRRQRGGPVDPALTILRFTPEGEPPVEIVSFGAHPVIVAESAPVAISADFPGALRECLRRKGIRMMFLAGSVGGLNPDAAGTDADSRITSLVERLERARAGARMETLPVAAIETRSIDVPLSGSRPRILPSSPFGELLLSPLRWWLRKMATDALGPLTSARLHLLRLGEAAILGTPCDLGVHTGLALQRAIGGRFPIAASHCNGYVGYVHLRDDYDHVPSGADRALTLYENALSVGGWELGNQFVRAVEGSGASIDSTNGASNSHLRPPSK